MTRSSRRGISPVLGVVLLLLVTVFAAMALGVVMQSFADSLDDADPMDTLGSDGDPNGGGAGVDCDDGDGGDDDQGHGNDCDGDDEDNPGVGAGDR